MTLSDEATSETDVLGLIVPFVPFPLVHTDLDSDNLNHKGTADPGATWTHHSITKGMPPREILLQEDGARTPFVLGVDEAGRGPVLGPMVYALAYAPVSKKPLIKGIGVDDSKKLTELDRDRLFAKMMTTDYRDWIGFAVTSISPRDISEGMLRRTKYNLNQQAYDTTIALIRETLAQGVNVTEIYVDTVGKEKPYQLLLEREFPGISITVTTKADSKFPIVSAASIFAKVIRDFAVKHWVFSEPGVPGKPFTRVFGSGYPGDPNTKKWLRQNIDPVFGFPDVIRFSWSTCAKLLEKSTATVTWPDDEPGDKLQNGNIGNYFKKADPPVTSKKPGKKHDDTDEASDVDDEDDEESEDILKAEECEGEEDEEEEEEAETSKRGKRLTRNGIKTAANSKAKNSTANLAGKRKRGSAGADAEHDFSEEEGEGVAFKFCKSENLRREKPLVVDSGRDALVFRGLSFRHVATL